MQSSSISIRRKRATESFKTAYECIGRIEPGMAIFAITRGQWSMIDAVLACLDQVGPASLSIWTWNIAEYEVESFSRLFRCDSLKSGLLIIEQESLKRKNTKNGEMIALWQSAFGERSVRLLSNHAKIATIESPEYRLLLRGSMNLNHNPHFEQFDLTEGGIDFELVRNIEQSLPYIPPGKPSSEYYRASKMGDSFVGENLTFGGGKVWTK